MEQTTEGDIEQCSAEVMVGTDEHQIVALLKSADLELLLAAEAIALLGMEINDTVAADGDQELIRPASAMEDVVIGSDVHGEVVVAAA